LDTEVLEWFEALPGSQQQELLSLVLKESEVGFEQYQKNPVLFCEEQLNENLTEDIKEAMMAIPDTPVILMRSANAVGKTHSLARIAVWFYKCFPNCQIYTTAAPPLDNLKRLLWGEVGKVVRSHEELFSGDVVNQLDIKSPTGSFMTGVAIPATGTPADREAKFSGKHSENLMFIVDEGDAVPNEIYRAIESSMSGGNAKLIVTFNPRAKRGTAYQMERDSRAKVFPISAFSHPNVTSGKDLIPGAVTRGKTVERILKWSRPLQKDEQKDHRCYDVPEFLVGARTKLPNGEMSEEVPAGTRVITESAFYYMVLGEYPAQSEQQLINYDDIAKARLRYDAYVAMYGTVPPLNVDGLGGLDVSEYGKDYNVLARRYSGLVLPFDKWSGVDPDTTAIKAATKIGNLHCYVDSTGVGSGVPMRMNRLSASAEGVKVASKPTWMDEELGEFNILRDQLWWEIREWLRKDNTAMLPPDEELLEELSVANYSTDTGKIKVMKKDVMRDLLGRSPNKADALGLTFAPRRSVRMGFA